MRTFQINVLIRFLVSSTRFKHLVFFIRKTIFTCNYLWYVFLFMHLCKQSVRWNDVLDTIHLMQNAVKCREV